VLSVAANVRNEKQPLETALVVSETIVLPHSDTSRFLGARDFLLSALNYQEAKAGFAWPELPNFNWALDYFDTLAERCTNPALVYVDDKGAEDEVSFQSMRERSNKAANFLRDLGLKKGDRILLMLQNCAELFEVFLGAMKVGCVIIPASTLLTAEDVRDRMVRGKARCVVTNEEFSGRVDQAIPSETRSILKISLGSKGNDWIDYAENNRQSSNFKAEETFTSSDGLLIYFTSGTTAKPKLVLHTHGSYPIGHLTTMYWIGLKPGDLHYNISAPGWAKYAWSSIFGVWNAEATTFVYNYSDRFNPKEVLRVIQDYKVNSLCAPPTVWRHLLLEDIKAYSFSLRQLVSAGEPLNPEIIQKVRSATGLTIREGFGQSESTLLSGIFPGLEPKLGSMGVEAPGFEIGLLNNDHVPVQTETEGVLAVRVKPSRPVGLMTAYIDPPEKNLEVFVGDWYLTGDLAYRDKDGYFWFIGRADDVFKSSDYRISAFELESELMVHPLVTEVAVVASPDSLRGLVPKAFVTLKPNVAPSRKLAFEIFKFTRDRMAPYKRPRIIQFIEELPKTVSGKIKRTELRKHEADIRTKNARSKNEYFESDFQAELKTQRK
jgi:acetyl-CoA synthetase